LAGGTRLDALGSYVLGLRFFGVEIFGVDLVWILSRRWTRRWLGADENLPEQFDRRPSTNKRRRMSLVLSELTRCRFSISSIQISHSQISGIFESGTCHRTSGLIQNVAAPQRANRFDAR
jgi:hypothetical protein